MPPIPSIVVSEGLHAASVDVVAADNADLVLQKAVDGVVRIDDLALARIWIRASGSHRMIVSAGRGIEGMLDSAPSWPAGVARAGEKRATSRLFHKTGVEDAGWMRSNQFRAYAGFPLPTTVIIGGVFDVFARNPLQDESVRALEHYVRLVATRLESLPRAAQSTERHEVVIPTDVSYDEAERRFVRGVLARTEGRIEGSDGAAASLGIPPSTLRSRLKRLRIR